MTSAPRLAIRSATVGDLNALHDLETRSFTSDQVSRRALAHLVMRAHAATLVADHDGQIVGSVIVRFRRGSRSARIYSIAVASVARGQGVGARLLHAAEDTARHAGCTRMHLEIRKDNAASISLFEKLGYRRFAQYPGYYEDGMDAWRYEKSLVQRTDP